MAYEQRMRINAVPRWQGAVNERAAGLPGGCLALSAMTAPVLNRPVNHVAQDRQTAPIEDGVANRSVLTVRNRAMLRLEVGNRSR